VFVGAYKIPGFNDVPQQFNIKLLRDVDWPNLGTIHSSKGIGVRASLCLSSLLTPPDLV